MPATTKAAIADTYMKLICEFPLRRIKNAADHAKAKKLVLHLSVPDTDRGTAEYLDVLIDLVIDYEKRAEQVIGTSNVSAADLVRHRIEERDMSISSLARLIGVPQSNLSEMLNGNRDWSKNAIRSLSARLNIKVDRFLA